MSMSKARLKKVLNGWRGKDKVEILDLQQVGDIWQVVIRDGGSVEAVPCSSYEEAEQIATEFGGRNIKTFSADPMFLQLMGWGSEDLLSRGHIPKQVLFRGRVQSEDSETDNHPLPLSCGQAPMAGSMKKDPPHVVLKYSRIVTNTIGQTTVVFKDPGRLDMLVSVLSKSYPSIPKHVEKLKTQNIETGDTCLWKRKKVGDGTKAVELLLMKVNGKVFWQCRFKDVLRAGGNMCEGDCLKIPKKLLTYDDQLDVGEMACLSAVVQTT